MSILQINIWMCECTEFNPTLDCFLPCPNTAQTTEWVDVYNEPTVNYPPEDSEGRKWGDTAYGDLVCPDCLEKSKSPDEKPPSVVVGVKTLDLGAKIAGQG